MLVNLWDYQSFDITSYIKDIYAGKNKTLELRATNESSAYIANVFSGESSTYRPKVVLTHRDDFDVNPELDIDKFDTEMRIFSILNKGFEAMSFDGIAKPNSAVQFQLVKKGTGNVIKQIENEIKTSEYTYDVNHRLIETKTNEIITLTKTYDANHNLIEETNKNGIKTLYEYDGLNQRIKAQNHEEHYVPIPMITMIT